MTIEFGIILESERQAAGYETRHEFAKASGVDDATISRIISGEREPSPRVALRLADTLNLEAERRSQFLIYAVFPADVAQQTIRNLSGISNEPNSYSHTIRESAVVFHPNAEQFAETVAQRVVDKLNGSTLSSNVPPQSNLLLTEEGLAAEESALLRDVMMTIDLDRLVNQDLTPEEQEIIERATIESGNAASVILFHPAATEERIGKITKGVLDRIHKDQNLT